MEAKNKCASCDNEGPLFSYENQSSPYCEVCLVLETIVAQEAGKQKPLLWRECLTKYKKQQLVKNILNREVNNQQGISEVDSAIRSEASRTFSSGHRGNRIK